MGGTYSNKSVPGKTHATSRLLSLPPKPSRSTKSSDCTSPKPTTTFANPSVRRNYSTASVKSSDRLRKKSLPLDYDGDSIGSNPPAQAVAPAPSALLL